MEHKSIKTLKQIHIPTYIREGGVVKGYTRLQNVKIQEFNREISNLKVRDIIPLMKDAIKLHNFEYDGYMNYQKEVLRLYSDGIHGISDPGLSRDPTRLPNVYNAINSEYGDVVNGLGARSAYNKLTDHGYISDLHSINVDLEKKFNKEFGLETERVNQFVFRTKLNLPDENITEGFQKGLDGFGRLISNYLNEHFGISDMGSNPKLIKSAKNFTSSVESLVKDTEIPQKKLEKTLIPAVIMAQLFKPEHFYDPSNPEHLDPENLERNVTRIDNLLQSRLKNETFGLPKELRDYDAVLKDPDKDIKKPFLKYMNDLPHHLEYEKYIKNHPEMENSRQHLVEQMKNLKADEIVPNFVVMMENGITLKHSTNPIFKKSFSEFCSKLSSKMFNIWNGMNSHVYISNNPMDFVTMSPQGTITSCQSITENDGGMRVNPQNINLINSLNLDKSHDFLLYTLSPDPSKKNTKMNRMSLHWNTVEDKFINCEGGKIYSERGNYYPNSTNFLGKFLQRDENSKLLHKINPKLYVIDNEFKSILDKYNPMNDMAKECLNLHITSEHLYKKFCNEMSSKKESDFDSVDEIENFGSDLVDKFNKEIFSENDHIFGDVYETINNIENETSDHIYDKFQERIRELKDSGDNMLYGGNYHNILIRFAPDSDLNENINDLLLPYEDKIHSSIKNINNIKENLTKYVDNWVSGMEDNQQKKHETNKMD